MTRREKWGPRIGLCLRPSVEYVAATWGTWIAGGIVVPLSPSQTPHELQRVVQDASIALVRHLSHHDPDSHFVELKVLTHAENRPVLPALAETRIEVMPFGEEASPTVPRLPDAEDGALLLYTSGTTGQPKGALHTHRSINAQMRSLSEAWEWRKEDVLVHGLPLHHIHGIVNALYTAHRNGACVHLLPRFSPSLIWSTIQVRRLCRGQNSIY